MVLGNFESHNDIYKTVQGALQYFTKGKKKRTRTHLETLHAWVHMHVCTHMLSQKSNTAARPRIS